MVWAQQRNKLETDANFAKTEYHPSKNGLKMTLFFALLGVFLAALSTFSLFFLLKGTNLLEKLVNRWKRIGCAGHFEPHHKWWQVLLFWALVALAVLAFLALRD
jgi:succinate dehydrogenase hydrophobic anchor subunit